jgi:NAD(P)-dependent dehydrogenase (short-subunit alcohol dehydrogenase family)
MDDLQNKTAFVTGAASGIGLALSKALLSKGANVVMADIDTTALEKVASGINVTDQIITTHCNVADYDSVVQASETAKSRFGKVHLLFNNAGVSLGGASGNIDPKDWRWIVDINLMGVIYGVEVFLPLMQSHGEGGYIVNTASMAGHFTTALMAPYNATKFAVVGYSESLRQELENTDIGISILCPTWVKSNIYNAPANRPSEIESKENFTQTPTYHFSKHLIDNGMSAEEFAELTLGSIAHKRFYVFNDPAARVAVDARRDHILADYDACLADLKK